MNLFERHEMAKKNLDSAKEVLLDCEVEIYNYFKKELDSMETGTFNRNEGEHSIKIVKKNNVTVDQKKASELDFGFTVKRNFSKTEYAKLNDEQKKMVDACITEKPSKPSFKIERL